ncbi:hypothetical protein M397_13420 (plasmid) [Staphylococcus aureus S1]|nr:hypothetical protein M397_13420 [Staphylococcus aureus S1]
MKVFGVAFFQKGKVLIPPCKWGLGGIFATAKTSLFGYQI